MWKRNMEVNAADMPRHRVPSLGIMPDKVSHPKRGAMSLRRSRSLLSSTKNENNIAAIRAHFLTRRKVNPSSALRKLPALQNHLGSASFFSATTSARIRSLLRLRVRSFARPSFPSESKRDS